MRRGLPGLILVLQCATLSSASCVGGGPHNEFFTSLAFGLVLALFVTLWAAPRFYQRALRKRGDKNLARFLMNDPKMRDAILEARTGKKPGAKPGEQPDDKGEAHS